jgi:hypothetical protein
MAVWHNIPAEWGRLGSARQGKDSNLLPAGEYCWSSRPRRPALVPWRMDRWSYMHPAWMRGELLLLSAPCIPVLFCHSDGRVADLLPTATWAGRERCLCNMSVDGEYMNLSSHLLCCSNAVSSFPLPSHESLPVPWLSLQVTSKFPIS